MDKNVSYTKALEDFILDELLPAYIEHCRKRGIDPNKSDIVKHLFKLMKKQKEVPALFKPKE